MKVRDLLVDLSKEQSSLGDDDLRRLAQRAVGIYKGGYRNEYSDILTYVRYIGVDDGSHQFGVADSEETQTNDRSESDGPLDTLTYNLRKLRDFVNEHPEYGSETFWGLHKLCDHVAIEIQRYRDQADFERRLMASDQDLAKMSARVGELKEELEQATSDLNEAKDKASRIQMEMVAILGIFAAIVMTFTGGLSLIGDAMTAVSEVPIFESVFVVMLCAIVVLNIIVFLLMAIQKIMAGRQRPRREGKLLERGWAAAPDNGAAVTLNVVFLALLGIDALLWLLIG